MYLIANASYVWVTAVSISSVMLVVSPTPDITILGHGRIAMVRCNLIAQLAHREPRAIVNRQIRIELRQLKSGYITTTAHSVSMSLFAHLQTHRIT